MRRDGTPEEFAKRLVAAIDEFGATGIKETVEMLKKAYLDEVAQQEHPKAFECYEKAVMRFIEDIDEA